ncbi:uncharacterized protein MYCFIDRAFT_213911 [Pseudocercospora fijiensis CIRAD86]|uniref:Uncharacterized protein n=1 Tax=Pseudocercospora fijiensis (strain CIRAD86) TaxID=383855 RepID=M2Z706_PSEFD|nr:uncharacterized protein MYCFIDRAFT_213911 [Pseudocercospora fijiensis CIRAD86]EME85570.1 hypothetical protein MYCFIDRAFT_213911 [Pseudocercospora fijiensis CIRAD86]
MLHLYLLPPALLLAVANAQKSTFQSDMSQDASRAAVSASLMNITFSTTTTADCAQNTTNTDALSIAIRTVPKKSTCFNIAETFSGNNTSAYSTKGYTCDNGIACGVNYTVMSWSYNSAANYSQIWYTQTRNPFTFHAANDTKEPVVGGRLTFSTFNGEDCKKVKVEGTGHKAEKFEWNCNSEDGECSTVPFPIKSFSISMTDPDDVNDRNCTIAKTADARSKHEEQRTSTVFIALAVAFAGVAFLV